MRRSSHVGEQGQSLVLLALAAVALLGAVGLALDGGWLVVQRRRAQNTADNVALAAALKKAQFQDFQSEGLAVAAQNNYTNDGATNVVTVVSPPYDGAFAGDTNYVQATITQTVNTAFIQLVFPGPAQLTVRAVARAEPSNTNPVVTGQAVVGLDKTACEAIFFSGSGNTHIMGGGIFSNSTSPGNNCYSGQKPNASGSVIVDTGGINVVDDWNQNENATVSPAPTTGVDQITWPAVPDPPCNGTGMTDKGQIMVTNGNVVDLEPGRYTDIVVNPGGILNMAPGLYCLLAAGADFDIGGSLSGTGVHIYMGPNSGAFNTNAGSDIYLEAPSSGNCFLPTTASPKTPDVCDQNGLLLHVDEENTNTIRINGGASTTYIGTFLAPSAQININGGSGTSGVFNSQIIGATVEIEGTADVTIVYIPEQNYNAPIPPKVWLAE